MNRLVKLALLPLLISLPAVAHAEWKEATTTNFIVYSEGGDARLREFATKLEKFNFVLRTYHGVKAPPSPIKLKVYLFPTIAAVGKMAGGEGVAGYYIPRSRGLMMVGTSSRASQLSGDIRSGGFDRDQINSESILLHEYTHHFMYQYFPATYPTWYSEGFAEFWGATNILPNDVVEVGQPVNYRYGSFAFNRWLPLKKLLTAQSYADVPEVDLLYAQGWLLVRSAFDDSKRRKQLQAYLNAINGGASYENAMKSAFGDVGALDSELHSYAGKSRFSVLQIPFKKIEVGPIALRSLSPAEDAMMTLSIELAQGILKREAPEFAGRVRSAAKPFPNSAFALTLLSEAERLAGHHGAAVAAADKALAVAPNHGPALLQKALAEMDRLKAGSSSDAKAWNSARQILVRAARVAPNDPLVLEAFYDSHAGERGVPPEAAQAALYKAMELAPSDFGPALQGRRRFREARHDPRGDHDHPSRRLRSSTSQERKREGEEAARGARGEVSRSG